MRDVYVAGVGMIRFGRYPERPIEDMGREAVLKALDDAGVRRTQIEEAFCGSGYGGPLIGQRILRDLGMSGISITNVENACSSSASALREAVSAVALGRADTVLVIGVEKLSRFGGGTIPLETTDIEVGQGMVMPALYAMRAQRYMHKYGATSEHLAMVSVKAHKNGSANPYAQYQKEISLQEVLQSRMIADPLTLYMCCPTADGAAAAVITIKKKVRQWGLMPIRVAASVLQSGLYKTGFRDMAVNELSIRTSKLAYEQAGLGPMDIDLAEVHDAFAIAEIIYYEALG
ncbi:MAG: thiolase family protein, partial [Desulfatirhabdiaceae bacterium]|nr:thiolase family protein [Desulfatirhabdiaceae bacterium]